MAAGVVGVFAIIFVLFFFVIGLGLIVLRLIGQWKVFEKAGKPGWAAIIPCYNNWVLFEISGVNPIFSLFYIGGNLLSLMGNFLSAFAKIPENYNYGLGIFSVILSLSSLALNITFVVFTVIACINLAKCFKKEGVYGLGLAFLGVIFFPLLGFEKNSEYEPIKK